MSLKSPLWPALNLLQWAFIAAWSACWITIALGLAVATRSRRPSLAMARRVWAPGILWAAGARLDAAGAETLDPGRAWFFACNHQSLGDVPALLAASPVDLHFVAKRELRRVPFLGWYMAAMGMVFVDRERRASGRAGALEAAELLRRGRSVMAFPGGTRGAEGEPQRFKSGALAPPLAAGVPVVPVAVAGAARVLPPGSWRLRPGIIRVRFGEPVAVDDLGPDDRVALTERVEQRVEALRRDIEGRSDG